MRTELCEACDAGRPAARAARPGPSFLRPAVLAEQGLAQGHIDHLAEVINARPRGHQPPKDAELPPWGKARPIAGILRGVGRPAGCQWALPGCAAC